jgi:hypothetical protein
MAGLFPRTGVTKEEASNANDPTVVGGCEVLFYKSRCKPRFDAAQANAVISELGNAINIVKDYECDKLNNLRTAFEYIRNLCNQPTKALNVDDAYIAGCYAGLSGLVDVQLIIDYIKDLLPTSPGFSICNLPYIDTPLVNTDTIAVCRGTTDNRVSLQRIAQYVGVSQDLTTGLWFGPTEYIGSAQSLPNRRIPVTNRTAVLIQDKRATTGGQNPQDPGSIVLNGDDILLRGTPQIRWQYGGIILLVKAPNYENPAENWWYRVHESGVSWRLPNSPGTVTDLEFQVAYSNVRCYTALPLV